MNRQQLIKKLAEARLSNRSEFPDQFPFKDVASETTQGNFNQLQDIVLTEPGYDASRYEADLMKQSAQDALKFSRLKELLFRR